jgi:hypothetical protein
LAQPGSYCQRAARLCLHTGQAASKLAINGQQFGSPYNLAPIEIR